MTYRVVQWSTGNVGVHAIAGIDANPALELVGCFVSNPAKEGVDVGRLANLGRDLGVTATTDADALIALKPDCFVNGVDPGFGNDQLPLVITGISEYIDEVRCYEILNYATYNQAEVLFDIMGFAQPMDHVPMLLQPGVPTLAWGSVIAQLAAGLGVELDSIDEWYERVPAPFDFEVDAGPVKEGTVAGLHFELRGMVNGKAVVVLEHVTRLHDDIAPDWPQPAGEGCYRVKVTGEPIYTVDMQLLGTDGDHNTAGLKATAMRIVNAVPAVVDGEPGHASPSRAAAPSR